MSEIEEIAKTTGKAIDATRELGGFLERFLAKPLDEVSGMLTDTLKVTRWKRQVRLMDRVQAFLVARGLERANRTIPIKVLLPLLQEGSLEEDDELQDRWACLLTNAADIDSGTEIRQAFITILKDVTSLDARNLEQIYSFPAEEVQGTGVWTGDLPDSVAKEARPSVTIKDPIRLSISNLMRLGLVESATMWGGGQSTDHVYQTDLGREFLKACSSHPAPMHR